MFLVFEAEEDGLLGAFHYINNPIVPLASTVAVLNSDMIGRDEDDPQWNTHAEDNRNQVNVVGRLYNPDLRRVIEAESRYRAQARKLIYLSAKDLANSPARPRFIWDSNGRSTSSGQQR